MKKIAYFLGVALSVVALASCSDDTDNPYAHTATLSVVSSNVVFNSPASSGTVEVSSQTAITAKVSAPWAAASVSGSTVTVTVEQNPDVEGRAALLTIYNADDSVQVSVQQLGMVARLASTTLGLNDNASTHYISFEHSSAVDISSDADWFTATMTGDSLAIDVKANNTGHMRSDWVHVKTGDYADSVYVVQAELKKDILGTMYLGGTFTSGSNKGKTGLALAGKLMQSKDSLYFYDAEDNWKIPMTWDDNTKTLSLAGGSLLGKYSSYYIFTALYSSTTDYFTWSSDVSVTGSLEYGSIGEDGVTLCAFADNGSWGEYGPVDQLWLYAFSAATPSSSTRVGTLMALAYPFLARYDSDNAPAATAAKGLSRARTGRTLLRNPLTIRKDNARVALK